MTQDLVLATAMLQPIGDVEAVRSSLQKFMEFKQKLLGPDDKQKFKIKIKKADGSIEYAEREFCKKPGCQKLALAFFISADVVHEETTRLPDGKIVVKVWAKAIHTPSGRFFTCSAACSSEEKMTDEYEENIENGKKTKVKTGRRILYNPERVEHDVESHAQTRATNRAILSILGSGEISAEEVTSDYEEDEKSQTNFCQCPEDIKKNLPPDSQNKCRNCSKLRSL